MEKVISWIGTITSIVGAMLVATGVMIAGYILFIIGSGLWLGVGIYRKDSALWAINAAFLAIDFVGLFNYWKG